MLVGEDLADVVQQRAPLREGDVQLQLGGHHSGEPGDLLGVLQDVLAVRGAVLHAPDELHQLGIHAADTDVVDGLFARFEDTGIDVGLGLAHDFFDAPRVDPAVGDQTLEGEPAHLAPDRLEAGYDDRVGGVIDDDVHAGRRLERADVPSLAADDAALHLIRWQHHG